MIIIISVILLAISIFKMSTNTTHQLFMWSCLKIYEVASKLSGILSDFALFLKDHLLAVFLRPYKCLNLSLLPLKSPHFLPQHTFMKWKTIDWIWFGYTSVALTHEKDILYHVLQDPSFSGYYRLRSHNTIHPVARIMNVWQPHVQGAAPF